MDAVQRAEVDTLITRRATVGLAMFAVGALFVATVESLSGVPPPPGAWWGHAAGILLPPLAMLAFRLPVVRRRPVPMVLVMVAVVCALRVASGIGRGDVSTTVVMCVVIALATGGGMPWGVRAQLVTAALCGTAIAVNAWWVSGHLLDASGRAAAGIAVALAVSVVLASERRLTRVRVLREYLSRRRAEEELARLNAELEQRVRDRTAQLEAVIENTEDAIWSIDRHGAVTVMNGPARARYARRYLRPYDEVAPGRGVPEPVRDQIYELYARALAGEHVQIETTVAAPGGTGTFLVSVHPIVEDGAIVGATVFSKDVTERKRAEEQARRHQAELAHVLRLGTMGEMAAGLAHEINQPLGAIANFASGAAHRLRARSMSAEDLLPVVEQIAAEALRGGEIIRRLRDLVRKEDPAPEPAELNPLVTAALRLVEAEARQREVTLRAELAADLPPVRANATQIEQVVLNLLLNAIDAVERDPAGGRLITVRSAATAAGAEVAVEDSGPGLPPPPADVFAPFFTTKGSGLGLGLSISRSIVEAHGGRLDARANPGGGSTFVMSLPRAAVTA